MGFFLPAQGTAEAVSRIDAWVVKLGDGPGKEKRTGESAQIQVTGSQRRNSVGAGQRCRGQGQECGRGWRATGLRRECRLRADLGNTGCRRIQLTRQAQISISPDACGVEQGVAVGSLSTGASAPGKPPAAREQAADRITRTKTPLSLNRRKTLVKRLAHGFLNAQLIRGACLPCL